MTTAVPPGKIACPHCQGLIKAPSLAAGSVVNCPKCSQPFRLGDQGSGSEGGRRETQPKPPARPATSQPVPPPPSQSTVSPPPIPNPKSPIPNSETAPASPKPKKPDLLVDPNLLAPPPPKVKEKPKDVAVVCNLCGTRTYVKIEKIGQEVKCPDCHSRNVVVGPKEEGASAPQGPTLEGTENYGMSAVVEKPRYRPLQAARGEYEVLSALDPATVEHRLTVPSDKPRKKKLVAKPAADQDGEEEEEHGELTLEEPLERTETARDPRSFLPQPEIEPENALYDGRYDDGLIGDMVDPRSPDAWKKAPFVYGIVEFLFRPSTLLRGIMFAMLFTAVAGLSKFTITLAQQDGFSNAFTLLMVWISAPVLGVWLFSFAAAFHAIVETTGNGGDEVSNWPDWNVFGWFGPALFVLAAAFLSALPGGVIGGGLAFGTGEPMVIIFAVVAPVVLSMLLLFPFLYCSMMIEDNVFAVASAYTLRSLTIAGDAWLYFCMYSLGVALLGTCALGMLIANNIVFTAVGAAASMALLILYARLLGRLMWVAAQRDAKHAG